MRGSDFDWAVLPDNLRYGLLLGGVGKPHLTGLARAALNDTATLGLGLDLLLAAWEAGPLDGALAGALVSMDGRARFLPPRVRAMADAAAANWREPEQAGAVLAEHAARREHSALLDWLDANMRAQPQNLYWRRHLLDTAYLLCDWDRAESALADPWPQALAAAREAFRGDVLFQQGDFAGAERRYAAARPLRPSLFRRGQCLFRMGRPDEAAGQWRMALAQAPWNVNLLLRLHDRLAGLDTPGGDALPGSAAVCLYTSGKASELDATLAALFASELRGAAVVVLDNASPDATPQVLSAWKDRVGEALTAVTLPVNIGAPAARNWLMRHEAVASRDFTAYLDDDALVPPDWQARLAQAVRAYPRAGVWGCKVVDLAAPGRIQHAEVNLYGDDGPEPSFATLSSQDLDFGQFDALRPCLSVTGCFHLFRADALRTCGDFDIRFSPTQYDDLDHDLRLSELGLTAVCQGHCGVRHARLSGALLNQNAQATGNSMGNLGKLAAKHPPRARLAMRLAVEQVLLEDAIRKKDMIARCGT
ncbi:MAG: glycosyltransferase [Acidobacteriota bacterium]